MEAYGDNECLDRKRVCVSSDYDNIDNATWLWFKRARALNMPVSGPYIQQKALELEHYNTSLLDKSSYRKSQCNVKQTTLDSFF